jgi:hypothetical protein
MARASIEGRRAARENQQKVQHSAKLGSGARFKAVEAAAAASGARNPGTVAAAAGRKKYGAKRFAAMGAAGRKHG